MFSLCFFSDNFHVFKNFVFLSISFQLFFTFFRVVQSLSILFILDAQKENATSFHVRLNILYFICLLHSCFPFFYENEDEEKRPTTPKMWKEPYLHLE